MIIRSIIGLLILLLCAACGDTGQNTSALRIVYGLTLEPSGFDPHINQAAEIGIVLRQVYDTLVYRHPETKEFVPGLATGWEISEDGLVYTFHLRENVTFHDGTPFNAQAVAVNLDRITNPDTRSQKALFLLGPYMGYEVVNASTIRIRLSEPYSPLLDSFAQIYLGIASPKALSEYSLNRYQFHQVGTGPFEFVEYVPADRIVLQRNDSYTWGPQFYEISTATNRIQEIEYRFYTDPATRLAALENGEAHVVGELLPVDARTLTANSRVQLNPTAIPGQPMQFLFNTGRFPTDNIAVRQALLYGTNRNAIVDSVYQGFSPVAWGPLAASTLFYNRGLRGAYAYDVGQAQALLSAAGFRDENNDGVLEIGGINLELTIIVPPWGLIPEVAQLLQDQWRILGIRANLQAVSGLSALLEAVNSGEYNLVAFNSFGIDPVFLNQYFLSAGSNNWTGYESIELDNILVEAARQTDPAVRANLYTQAQNIIMEQALVLPIRDYTNLNASTANIENLIFDPYGWFPLLNNVNVQS